MYACDNISMHVVYKYFLMSQYMDLISDREMTHLIGRLLYYFLFLCIFTFFDNVILNKGQKKNTCILDNYNEQRTKTLNEISIVAIIISFLHINYILFMRLYLSSTIK